MESVKPSFFRWTLSDGRQTHAECAFPNGGPAAEPNERQTIAIIGDAGGWSNASIEKLEIVGPLMLLRPDGTRFFFCKINFVSIVISIRTNNYQIL